MRFYIVVVLFFLVSCQPALEKINKPENLIDKDTFTLVLTDMMLLEAYVQNKYKNVTKYYNLIQNSSKEIFKKYNVDSLSYANSMDYYGQKQEILKEIYIEIQNKVNVKRMELENK